MGNSANTLIILGVLLFLGLATDAIGRRTRLPRVTLLLIFGFLIGPAGLGFLSPKGEEWSAIVAQMALVMVGFLLGGKFTLSALREHGKLVFWFSVSEVAGAALVVLIGLLLAGMSVEIALLLAGIAPATAPAATTDVVREAKADGAFTRTLLGIVAVDDAWGLIVFSVMLAAAQAISGQGAGTAPLLVGAWELGGSVLLGVGLGIPIAYLSGRLQAGEPTLVEALGAVFVCGGLAIWLDVSYLLASMVLGVVVTNLARHHTRSFHAIEGIEWPFMILFFVLAGASLEIAALHQIAIVGLVYIALRAIGLWLGAWTGGAISHADPLLRRWMGIALMPQAGVALGMALVATQRHPELGETILAIVVASTVVCEVIGPLLTRTALVRAGDVGLYREREEGA